MNSENSADLAASAAAAALPSPMDSPPRPAGQQPSSDSPSSGSPQPAGAISAPRSLMQGQAQAQQQQQQPGQQQQGSGLPTPTSSPPSLQHLQNQVTAAAAAAAVGATVPASPGGISNADLLKYLAANGLNPADLEVILRQRAYQQQAQGASVDPNDVEERLARRFADLDFDGRGAAGFQAGAAEEQQRWLRQQAAQQQQQQRLTPQQEAALLRGMPNGATNGVRRQDLMDPYDEVLMPGSGRVSPTGGARGYPSSLGSNALASNLENGISSQAAFDALRDPSVSPDSYANNLGGAFLNGMYGPGGLNAFMAAQQRKPFHQRDLPNVTPPEGYVCKLCFIEGHFLRHCPLYKERPRGEFDPYRKAFGDSVPPENYLCKLCFIPGHWMKNCALYKERNPAQAFNANASANAAIAAYRNGLVSKANLDLALAASARMAAASAYGYRSGVAPPGLGGQRKPFSTVPPDGYVCKICAVPGHWIQQCPLKHTQPPPHYQGLLAGERMAERLLA